MPLRSWPLARQRQCAHSAPESQDRGGELNGYPGRPPKQAGERLEQRSIRLTAAQWAKVDAAGLDALRKLIDRWRPN